MANDDAGMVCCPACNGKFPIKTDDPGSAVILKCPLCGTTLLSYADVLFILSREELKRIIEGKNLHNAASLFVRTNPARKNDKTQKIVRFQPVHISKHEALLSGEGSLPSRDVPISKEEIMNLMIDLNTTATVEDFLSKL